MINGKTVGLGGLSTVRVLESSLDYDCCCKQTNKKRHPLLTLRAERIPDNKPKISDFMPHTGIQRNPIPCWIRKNSPPANLGNFGLRHQSLTTERFDLRKCGINIISPDIDEQAIRLIFNRHPTLSYLDKATARPTFRHKLYI